MKQKERLKQFRGKLKHYRKEAICLTQNKFGALLDIEGYGAIERGHRGIGSETAPKLFAHFQERNEQEMMLGLLACLVDVDPEALHQQLESAAWRWTPEYPSDDREVIIAYICNEPGEPKNKRRTCRGRYSSHNIRGDRIDRWDDEFDRPMEEPKGFKILGWRDLLVVPEPIQGGKDE